MPYKDKEQQRRYQLEWGRKRRDEWFKENGPCIDCGTWENLELDHKNPSTKINHRVWSWSLARRLVELAKCVARCKSCHRAKTDTEQLKGTQKSQAILTEQVVVLIKIMHRDGATAAIISKQLDIRRKLIYRVTCGAKWKHVTIPQ